MCVETITVYGPIKSLIHILYDTKFWQDILLAMKGYIEQGSQFCMYTLALLGGDSNYQVSLSWHNGATFTVTAAVQNDATKWFFPSLTSFVSSYQLLTLLVVCLHLPMGLLQVYIFAPIATSNQPLLLKRHFVVTISVEIFVVYKFSWSSWFAADPRKLIHFNTHVSARVDLLTIATNALSLCVTIDMLTTTRAPVNHVNSYVLMALFKYLRPVSSDSSRQDSFW